MTADDAFDKLAGKNALNIPVAKSKPRPHGTTTVRPLPTPPPIERHTVIRRKTDVVADAMQVLDILDGDDIGDYRPRESEEYVGDFTTPTETDLDAVEGMSDAYGKSPEMMVNNVVQGEFYKEVAVGRQSLALDTEVDTEPVPAGAHLALDKARRLRRFAYLPLSDMEHFKTRARDIMTSLSAQTPNRASLAVTSVGRGAGQAELAIRLALEAAKRVDYRVLLADFDVRKPQVAKRLGLSSKYFTLSDVLRDSCPLGEALMMSEEDNLYVLPARESDRDGDEVLNDGQVQNLITQMHDIFDFVVMSCGPMEHPDATIICRHAGATALTAFCGYSSARALRAAAERLSGAGVNVAGLLLAGAV